MVKRSSGICRVDVFMVYFKVKAMDITELQTKLNNLNESWQSIRGLL